MWTMLPPPRVRMAPAASLVTTKAPTRLMRSTSAKSTAAISTSAERRRTAAELTRISTPPCSRAAVATSRSTSASLATSPLTALAWPPDLAMVSTTSASGSGRRPKTTTRAPSLAKRMAVARPIPVPAPVTIATLPSSVAIVVAPAEGLHGTAFAFGIPRRAPGGAKVHQGLIVVIGATGGYERFREVPDGLRATQALDPARPQKDPSQDAPHVRVHHRGIAAVGEGQDRAGRVAADALHAPELRAVLREAPVVPGDGFPRDAVKIGRAAVVAERAPCLGHFGRAGAGQVFDGRVARQELVVLGDDAIDLGLLEHHLGNKDAVRLAGAAPGQIAAVTRVPGEQPPVETTRHRPIGELHAGHCVTMGSCRTSSPCRTKCRWTSSTGPR